MIKRARGIASKINDDFYCLSCLHSFRTKDKCKFDIKVCENKVFWNIIMPSEETKIQNLTNIKNLIKHHKHDVSRDKNCLKKVCKYLREHAMKIINL